MIEDDRHPKIESLKADAVATRESREIRQEGFNPLAREADRRAHSSKLTTLAADTLLKGDDRLAADSDQTRINPDRTERAERQGDPTSRLHPAESLLQRERTQDTDSRRHDSYAEKKAKDSAPLPEDGSKSWFHRDGCAWLSREGTVTVETKLGEPSERQNFEGFLPTSTELGLKHHHDRAHAQGAGTGVEAPYGISLAPQEVNRELQNHGVEAFIRELQAHKRIRLPTSPNLLIKSI